MNALQVFFTDVSKVLSVLGLVAFGLAIFLHEPKSPWWRRLMFLIGIVGITGYIAAINATLNQQVAFITWSQPWVSTLYLAAPPALWIAFRGEFKWRKGLWLAHFFPAGLALVFREIRFYENSALLPLDVNAAIHYVSDFPGNTLYIKTYVVYFVAWVSAVYYIALASFTNSTKVSRRILGVLALLSFVYFYPYTLGAAWEMWRPYHLIVVLVVETLAIAYSFYVIVERYRGMFQVEAEVNEKSLPDVLEDDTFGRYLTETFHGEKHFLRDDYSMEMLSSDSGHSPAAWRSYFKSKDTTFLIVKKRMRIDHATQLIVDGYLDNHTVDALTSEIGYASRSTFYSAFQEIKGMPFPQYLQELRKS